MRRTEGLCATARCSRLGLHAGCSDVKEPLRSQRHEERGRLQQLKAAALAFVARAQRQRAPQHDQGTAGGRRQWASARQCGSAGERREGAGAKKRSLLLVNADNPGLGRVVETEHIDCEDRAADLAASRRAGQPVRRAGLIRSRRPGSERSLDMRVQRGGTKRTWPKTLHRDALMMSLKVLTSKRSC